MRVPLDECVDERLRHSFEGHECHSARYAGLAGLKNGALLAAAEAAGYEVIITTDQGIRYQQRIDVRTLAILVLCAPTNRMADVGRLAPAALRALKSIQPGQVVAIHTRV